MGMPMLLVLANIVFIMQAFKCLSINCVHSLNSCRGGLSLFLPCLVIQKTLPWVGHRKANLNLFFEEFARRLHWQRRLHVRQRDVWPPHRLRHQELVVTSPGRDRPFGGMDGLWSILQPQGHSGVPSSQKSHGESTMERFNHVTLISV